MSESPVWDIKDRCPVIIPIPTDESIDAYKYAVAVMPVSEQLRYLRSMSTIDHILMIAKRAGRLSRRLASIIESIGDLE